MGKIKNLFICLLTLIVSCIAINSVEALTKEELRTIYGRRFFLDTFEEGKLPSDQKIVEYAASFGDDEFETEREVKVTDSYTEYSVEEKDFEEYIKSSFEVTEEDLERIRLSSVKFDSVYDAIYNEGYYYHRTYGGTGFIGADYEGILGYKEFNSNIYQIYSFEADMVDSSTVSDDSNVIVADGLKYKISNYYLLKVQYDGTNIKYLAYQVINKEDVPKDSELILYDNIDEGLKFISAPQLFDISKDKNLTFKIDALFELFDAVYLDGKEVDKKNYTAKSGSTIITFNDEYTKTLSAGNHTLEVSFTDGTIAKTTFTINKTQTASNPDTAINFGYKALALIAVLSGSLYFLVRKKTKFAKHN